MMQAVVAVLAFGAIAALGLWWGVRRDDERRASPRDSDGGDGGSPLWYGNSSDMGASSSSWSDGGCDSFGGDSGGGDCGGDGGGGD